MISHLKSASKTQRSPISSKSKSKSKPNKNSNKINLTTNVNNNNNDNNNNKNNNYSMWNCPSCTLLNDFNLLHCTLCSTPRPQPQLLSVHPNYDDSINQQMQTTSSMINNINDINLQQNQQHSNDQQQLQQQPQQKHNKKRNKWKKVSSASSYLQFEYSDMHNRHNNANHYHSQIQSQQNQHGLQTGTNNKTSSINDMNNYAFSFEDYHQFDGYNDMESYIQSNISHSSTKNLKQLTRNKTYKNTYDAAGDSKFKQKIKSPTNGPISAMASNSGHSSSSYYDNYLQQRRKSSRRKKSRYSITDIFASNSSFILDHEYNEDDICNLILNNSTQTQTKIKFLKSIWPHILRVTTRVLNGSKFRCPICLDETISIGRITECGHCFCGQCLLHHLFSYQNSTKTEKDQRLIPEIKDDENYNFTDLFGHCPLCHEYVSFEQCRPLTVIRCKDYKVNDNINMTLIERRKGQQPQFSSNYNHSLNISTFRKFETEKYEIQHCQKELKEIQIAIKSSDPIYEEPFLRLLSIHVYQYKQYIVQQRSQYNIIDNNKNNKKSQFQQSQQECKQEISWENDNNNRNKKIPVLATSGIAMNAAQQQFQFEQQQQQQQQQHRYRKKKYVYQSTDGQLIFLHPHNYNMLKHDTNYQFDQFPSLLSNCKILEIERYEQSYDLRRKYPFLGFIPVDVAFSFVEVDLSHIVSKSTLKYFEKTTMDREQYRNDKKELAQQEIKHQQILEEQRIAAQKQRYARPQIDINDYAEFPSLVTPTKSIVGTTDESNSNSDSNNGENNSNNIMTNNSPSIGAISNKNKKSPLQRSWSQITLNQKGDDGGQKNIDSPSLVAISTPNNDKKSKNGGNISSGGGTNTGSGNRKKRRRGGRNRNKNKHKDKE